MRQHHTKVHDDPLPNRTCKGCGIEFYDPKARRAFCDDCNPNAGKHNGNWRDAKEETNCRDCGEIFDYYPSDKEGVSCPTCVEEKEEFIGTPSWKGKKTELVTTRCEYCGGEVKVRASKRAYGSGRFCSRDCMNGWMSENWQGKNHPRWAGGWNKNRNRNWTSTKKAILKRDQHRCQNCGGTSREIGREPDVHHIVPIRKFDDPTNAPTPDNLLALCRACHMAVEYDQIPLPQHP